jgi:hypothetical protein
MAPIFYIKIMEQQLYLLPHMMYIMYVVKETYIRLLAKHNIYTY